MSDTKIPKLMIVLMQILAYFVCFLIVKLFMRPQRVVLDSSNDFVRGTLLISNHQSKFDPFFILACLPFKSFIKLLPIRFPVLNQYFYNSLYNRPFPFMTLLGCFPVGETAMQRTKVVFYIRHLLETGHSILIFPEGQLVKSTDVQNFKRGLSFFLNDAKRVLFVRIYGLNGVFHPEDEYYKFPRITFSKIYANVDEIDFNKFEQYITELN